MTAAEQAAIAGRSVILYDGVCGLCNRVVRLLLRLDREGHLRFAPLESPIAAEILARFPTPPGEPEGVLLITAALMPEEAIYRRFDAVAEALRTLSGPWPLIGALLRLVPRPLREWSYGLIARNRYRLFGRYDTCPLPTPAQRSRILGV
jgi:predicted DCC family thiol-disulfide oxidoreductase YuxK